MSFKSECAYCAKEIYVDQRDFAEGEVGEPVCTNCQKMIEEGREDEIE
jgi:hypothetical protein